MINFGLALLRLNVPVNNFTVMSGRSHHFLVITSAFWEVNVSCSRIQHGGGRSRNYDKLSLLMTLFEVLFVSNHFLQ